MGVEKNAERNVNTEVGWIKFWRSVLYYAAIITLGVTIIGGVIEYILRVSDQIGDLKDRVGKMEGKMEMLQGMPTPKVPNQEIPIPTP